MSCLLKGDSDERYAHYRLFGMLAGGFTELLSVIWLPRNALFLVK